MSEKDGTSQISEPVAWMTPGGDVSRSLAWCKERCWPDGEQPTPLYASSYAQGVADAARIAKTLYVGDGSRLNDDAQDYNDAVAEYESCIRALSSPPSAISDETVRVPREPTPEMWDAAWTSIGLPYRAKLSMHEIKILFEKFHEAMLAAAPKEAR